MDISRRKPRVHHAKVTAKLSQDQIAASNDHHPNSLKNSKEKRGNAFGLNKSLLLLPGLIFFRLLNALLIQTTFVPDEVWQSVEVAHRWVYGYGALTWEWTPSVAIRSPLYPCLFAGMYKVMAYFGVDSRNAIIFLPRLFHGLLAGVVDFTIFLMAKKLSGESSAKWVLLAEVTSWFTAYCAPRSLSNSLEWALNAVAFYHYPWPTNLGHNSHTNSTVPFLLHVCLCVLMRPTAAILWGPVCLIYFFRLWKDSYQEFRRIFHLAVMIGLPCIAVSLGVDRLVYGRWTMNQLNFLYFNFLSTGANFYGVQPWHWYFSSGLPSILALHLPLALIGWLFDFTGGFYRLMKRGDVPKHSPQMRAKTFARSLAVWIVWTVFVFSCLPHKELRFLFPLFPLFIYYAGRGLFHLNRCLSRQCLSEYSVHLTMRSLTALLVVVNLAVAGYTCLVHQRGPDVLMSTLARQADVAEWHYMSPKPSVLILMPCHTTPYLSYLHINISLRTLSCDPDLSLWSHTHSRAYIDEADEFYEAPTRWLNNNYPTKETLPQYVAAFTELTENLAYGRTVLQWLQARNYSTCARIFHTHIVSHPRHSRQIAVWCARGWDLDAAVGEKEAGRA